MWDVSTWHDVWYNLKICTEFCFTFGYMNSSKLIHMITLRWRHNGRDGVSNHQHRDCLLNRLFGHRSKKTPELRVTGLCAGNSPGTGEFPAQMASNAENVSIWWRHHEMYPCHFVTVSLALIEMTESPGYMDICNKSQSLKFVNR